MSIPDWHHLLAQTSIDPAAVQLDVLKEQFSFLAQENARLSAEFTEKLKLMTDEQKQLSESFKSSISAIKEMVYLVGVSSVVLLSILSYQFGKTFKEAKAIAKETIVGRLETQMTAIADSRINTARRLFQREVVVDQTQVGYWLLGAEVPPQEKELLQQRGFQVDFYGAPIRSSRQWQRQSHDVVVLDLKNWRNAEGGSFGGRPGIDWETEELKRQLDLLLGYYSDVRTPIVVYVPGRRDYLDEVGKTRLIAPTNNKVTLIGMVVDSAYLAERA